MWAHNDLTFEKKWKEKKINSDPAGFEPTHVTDKGQTCKRDQISKAYLYLSRLNEFCNSFCIILHDLS